MADKQYKVVIPGIDGGGAQVFEAETPEQLAEQFQKAQENATAKIRELAQQNEQFQQQIQQLTPPEPEHKGNGFDKQKYFNMLYENPVEAQKYALQFAIGMPLDEFVSDYQQVRGGAMMGLQNAVNAQFAQRHPELLQVPQEDDITNATIITKILTDNQWPYDLSHLEAAFAIAKTNNQLKLNIPAAPEFAAVAAPTVVTRPTGSVNTSEAEEEFLRTAPLDKVKAYLEKKFPGKDAY